jgi:hypothetical protein
MNLHRSIFSALSLLLLLPAAAAAKKPPTTPAPQGEQVTLFVTTQPRVKAKVMWGRKNLGVTPLHLQRPRDSGPLDLIIVAEGYVPVHTRMYTFADDKLAVRLTKVDEKKALFGYKHEAPPPVQPGQPAQPGQPGQPGQPIPGPNGAATATPSATPPGQQAPAPVPAPQAPGSAVPGAR